MTLPPGLGRELSAILGKDGFFDDPIHRRVYDSDAYPHEHLAPAAVALPRTVEQVQEVVRACRRHDVSFTPRGAGTGLSGGALPLDGGLQIGLARMHRILDIDPFERVARVEAGVVNLDLKKAAARHGLTFAPDPSSESACTLGGNFAGNSGGPHCLKYGVMLPHVLGAKIVTPEGELLELGGRWDPGEGLDLLALLVGSEGTGGIVVELTLRLVPLEPARSTFLAVFETIDDAASAVSRLVARGIVPAALELVDRVMMQAVEEAYGFGFPVDAGAVLLIEIDGPEAAMPVEAQRIEEICRKKGCREFRTARSDTERAQLWKARKHAFGAVGRLSPNYATQDGVVPRAEIPRICEFIYETARRHGVTVGVVLHAGDGNLHPALFYDERDDESVEAAMKASGEIIGACIELGGSPTGEHGVGLEKREFLPLIYGPTEMAAQADIRDALDPTGRCNPGKVLPGEGGEGDRLRVVGRQVSA